MHTRLPIAPFPGILPVESGASHPSRQPPALMAPSELLTTAVVAIAFPYPDTTRKVFDVMWRVQRSPQKRDRSTHRLGDRSFSGHLACIIGRVAILGGTGVIPIEDWGDRHFC
ncbi:MULTISPECIES: hypothetical protein [unclassified Limnospira]|uniref:hypothetical protein n=2 Tax=Limnospira TaxID=2596745 RepID=UPI0028E13BF1|nr:MULTISPECIES: hypothetical protein [unclassified Limnospira]MDT9195257.1 hypothetical protein [Limnospira sp. PMC 1245.20]MDT9214335.1 hypothetical protein [Limnospira sp. PMC 1256.20]MDT9255288.1 hypothetical protein [Limnospira sp. PMC 1254.20]MDT9283016.1 hypothetical protein [Limnospira sp. PMC 1293.21]